MKVLLFLKQKYFKFFLLYGEFVESLRFSDQLLSFSLSFDCLLLSFFQKVEFVSLMGELNVQNLDFSIQKQRI